MAADLVGRRPAGAARAGGAWLFVEIGGDDRTRRGRARALLRAADAAATGRLVTDPAGQRALWRIREDAAGTATRMPGRRRGLAGLGGLRGAARPGSARTCGSSARCWPQHGLRGTPYGHFGEGCIHVRIDFDLVTRAGRRAASGASPRTLADLVVAHGGSLSGEHGDGQARAELLPKMYGPGAGRALRRVQGPVGPGGRHEPGDAGPPGDGWTRTSASRVLPTPTGRRGVRLSRRRR